MVLSKDSVRLDRRVLMFYTTSKLSLIPEIPIPTNRIF